MTRRGQTLPTLVALAGVILSAPTAATQVAQAINPGSEGSASANPREKKMEQHPYVGIWVTADGHIRQELLPNGRYDEARESRTSAYQGRYEVSGNHIEYWDDTGFIADGTFVSKDELHHGGMIFCREK